MPCDVFVVKRRGRRDCTIRTSFRYLASASARKHFYVMQYIEGRSLDRVVADLGGSHRDLPDGEHVNTSKEPERTKSTESFFGAAVARAMLRGKFEPTSRPQADKPAESLPPEGQSDTSLSGFEPRRTSSGGSCNEARSDSSGGFARNELRSSAYWRSVAGIGTQVASALHYAHRQGILHRDIKPGNLILDDKGIAWITDCGLAKLVDQEKLTHPGDAVGTLGYMAPEQLEGKTSARSDVYSLGLTLYELLTLRPAFDETSRHRLLRQVSRQEPPRPRTINADIPRDLETIVLKAIVRELVHRYETAGELADDLQRFLDDRPIRARRTTAIEHAWRWCRRNPALAGLTATMLILLVMGIAGSSAGYLRESRLRVQAESQQRRAKANRAIAAEAFEDVFTKLSGAPSPQTLEGTSDRLWLGSGGSPVVANKDAQVLNGLLKFYERFAEQNRDYTKWQHETARANRRVGDIQQRLGRFREAEEAYRRSLQVYEGLSERFLDRPEYAIELAATHSQLGNIALATDRLDEALQEFGCARQTLTHDAGPAADSASGRFELAKVYRAMGLTAIIRHHLRSTSELDGQEATDAEATIKQATKILSELAKELPSNGVYRIALAECYENLWGLCRLTGRDAEASRYRTEAIGILEELLAGSQDNPEYRRALARMYAITAGSPLADSTDISVESLQKAADLMEEVVASHPDVPDYRWTLGVLCGAIAEASLEGGQNDDSVEQARRRSIDLSTRLNDEFPYLMHYRGLLGGSLHTLAILQNHRRQPEAARESLERIIALLGPTGSPESEHSPVTMLLAQAYTGLADVLTQTGETALAEQAASKARKLWKIAPSALFRKMPPRLRDPWGPDSLPKTPQPDSATPTEPAAAIHGGLRASGHVRWTSDHGAGKGRVPPSV